MVQDRLRLLWFYSELPGEQERRQFYLTTRILYRSLYCTAVSAVQLEQTNFFAVCNIIMVCRCDVPLLNSSWCASVMCRCCTAAGVQV